MKKSEFEEQEKYCREFNTPEGPGCDNCPATDKDHCADRLRGLCDKLIKSGFKDKEVSLELDRYYGIPALAQLGLVEGLIEFLE